MKKATTNQFEPAFLVWLLTIVFLFSFQHALAQQAKSKAPAKAKKTFLDAPRHTLSLEFLPLRLGTLAMKYECRVHNYLSWVAEGGRIGQFGVPDLSLGTRRDWQQSYFEERNGTGEYNHNDTIYPLYWNGIREKTREKGFYVKLGVRSGMQIKETNWRVFLQASILYTRFSYEETDSTGREWMDGNTLKGFRRERTREVNTVTSRGIMLEMGIQYYLKKRWVLELHGGIGLGMNKDIRSTSFYTHYPWGEGERTDIDEVINNAQIRYSHYSTIFLLEPMSVMYKAGFSLGFAF